jgi:uncharacterized membrane protein (UPF0127 family)
VIEKRPLPIDERNDSDGRAATRRTRRRLPRIVRIVANGATPVCTRCEVADRTFARMRGLLGRTSLQAGHGMLLKPCPSVQTFFMRFPIDVVFIDKNGAIVGIARDLKPWRSAAARRAAAALELPAGGAADLDEGMILTLTPAE